MMRDAQQSRKWKDSMKRDTQRGRKWKVNMKQGGGKIQKRKRDSFERGCILAVVIYFLTAIFFYYAAGTQLFERTARKEIKSLRQDSLTGEFVQGYTVRQTFRCDMDTLTDFSFCPAPFGRINTGQWEVRLFDDTLGQLVYQGWTDMAQVTEGQAVVHTPAQRLEGMRGHWMTMELVSLSGVQGSAAGVWYHAGAEQKNQNLWINGEMVEGVLCFDVHGTDQVWTGPHYWQIILPIGLLFAFYCGYLIHLHRQGRKNLVLTVAGLFGTYRFLMRQLVSRDFKIKYKRSVLGVLWSFVNPLLMMSVQYFVFSTIFKTDIDNYPVYLLAGIVLFNFFSESTNISLYAVTGNAGLITKVYVPKYIYPVSKVVSTGINLLVSLLPLLIMSLATGVRITRAWLLLSFDLLFLLVFCIGMGFILSAVMVFFRDMQFIWSVFCMVFTYATPIFYPESILPDEWKGMLSVNPMYHFIRFFRKIILEGISPQPMDYVVCFLISAGVFGIGLFVFRKTQDKFIFYI